MLFQYLLQLSHAQQQCGCDMVMCLGKTQEINFIAIHMPSGYRNRLGSFLAYALTSMITVVQMLTAIVGALCNFL